MAIDTTKRTSSAFSTSMWSNEAACYCPPLSAQHRSLHGDDQFVPASPELQMMLRSRLQTLFPRSTPLSVILLHVTQVEPPLLSWQSGAPQQPHRRHGPASFIEQLLANLRRGIRSSDQLLLHESTGLALVLPEVDEQGAYLMLERIYQSIDLLQAATVIPPLTRETNVLLGSGSYPRQGSSLERLLYCTGCLARSLTLRPALPDEAPPRTGMIPFMQLPSELPARLQRLLPAALAREIRSVPVGCEQNHLTVAMAEPTNTEHIRRLQASTQMIIFPVACQEAALTRLLENLR